MAEPNDEPSTKKPRTAQYDPKPSALPALPSLPPLPSLPFLTAASLPSPVSDRPIWETLGAPTQTAALLDTTAPGSSSSTSASSSSSSSSSASSSSSSSASSASTSDPTSFTSPSSTPALEAQSPEEIARELIFSGSFLHTRYRWSSKGQGDAEKELRLPYSSFTDLQSRLVARSVELLSLHLSDEQAQDILCREVEQLFLRSEASFPFKRHYIGDIDAMFQRLRNYQHNLKKSQDRYTVYNIRFNSLAAPYFIPTFSPDGWRNRGAGLEYLSLVSPGDDYSMIDGLVDGTCQELQRLKAVVRYKKESPWDFWHLHGGCLVLIRTIIKEKRDLCSENLRELLYKKHAECTQFKPTLAFSMFTVFEARKVLDISSGWGDRMVGALAHPRVERYLGFDPNTNLKPGHDELLDRFASTAGKDRSRFQVRYEPFETAELGAERFNLCFSSPPFFDFEIYTDLPGQSIRTFPQLEHWLVGFLFKAMDNAWSHLDLDGHLILHITDERDKDRKVCEAMCLYADWRLHGSVFLGVISSIAVDAAGKHRPMWVWRKQSHSAYRLSNSPEEAMRRHFTNVHRLIGVM